MLNKIGFILIIFSLTLLFVFCSCANHAMSNQEVLQKIPVILDTDIGSDIDDMWALIMILNCPELDVKLITTSTGDVETRAKLTSKILELADRTDIPIAIGSSNTVGSAPIRQAQWIADYNISEYPGKIYQDGPKAIVDTIMNSEKPVKLIAIGPLPTVEAALELEPGIAGKAEFIGMHGSIEKAQFAEYNVKKWPTGLKKVFSAKWKKTITPLDTCGKVKLTGDKYKRFINKHTRLTDAIMEAYEQWFTVQHWIDPNDMNPKKSSTILYDTVAVYLAISEEYLNMKVLPLSVTDMGRTVVNEKSEQLVNTAIAGKIKKHLKVFF